MEDAVQSEKDNGDITYGAVYFIDLNNGPWFGINSDDDFRPASLLKVPLMLNLYRKAEREPGFLEKKVIYDGSNLDLNQNIKPSKQVLEGKSYSIEEYMGYMIKYSDNRATAELLKQADDDRLVDLFSVLGVRLPDNNTGEDSFLSLKQYASFFRILFNSSYLNYEHSEGALKLLTQSEFNQGMRAGIPDNIMVAHKFGEATDKSGTPQLHDCGVVYYPKKPYLLCVSVRGADFSRLEKAVKTLSGVAYKEVDKQVNGE
jgi:beta-lactamase class A